MTDSHIVPVGDLMWHTEDDCPCGPEVQPVPLPSGEIKFLYVHHALDGREFHHHDQARRNLEGEGND